jgi:C1A family cysteine protease
MRSQLTKILIKGFLSLLISAMFALLSENVVHATQPRIITIDKVFSESQVMWQFAKTRRIYSLNISGSLQLHEDNSLIRVILVRDDLHEYLVYEAYPLIVDSHTLKITDICEETCVLEGIAPRSLKIEVVNASLQINEVSVTDYPPALRMEAAHLQKEIKADRETAKIKKLNENIKKKGLKWIAGETSVSKLSYEEKKKLFGGKVPNLQGAEYYKGGIFEIKSPDSSESYPTNSGSSLVESFDWRSRHGANNPDSPYYDGDPTGSGWITSITKQGCGDCWAHSAVGATEALANLYFNQHLDADFGLDLSIQDVVSCSGAGGCSGGLPGGALSYIANTGVVDEACFPYVGGDVPCVNKCDDPNEIIHIAGRNDISYSLGEENIKQNLIDHGPLNFGIHSWGHSMVLVGYDKDSDDGETIWILKNSWGSSWGEDGYGKIKVHLSDMYLMYELHPPVTSVLTPLEIACHDMDGDGYYNWGISKNKPSSCPEDSFSEPDCDDSNLNLGPCDLIGPCINFQCEVIKVRVSASSDDAEEFPSGEMYLDSSDLELVYDAWQDRGNQTVGVRFNGVDIPQGAKILDAHVQFQVDEPNWEPTSLEIEGEDIDNAPSFLEADWNISSRARTDAQVSWSPEPWTIVGEPGPAQRTADISSIIQELVDRPGWASGNSLAIIITGTGKRVAESYDGDKDGAPFLYVAYTIPNIISVPAGDVAALKASIKEANGNTLWTIINLEAGIYTLTEVDNDADGPNGLPSITSTSPISIEGPDAETTIVERDTDAPEFRIFHVAPGGVLTLDGLTVRGGKILDYDGGAGIYNRGTVSIVKSAVKSNHTVWSGGGIKNYWGSTTIVSESMIAENVAERGAGGIASDGPLTITNSTISDNNGGGCGGGVGAGFEVTISGSVVSHNSSGSGGGIALLSNAEATIVDSIFHENSGSHAVTNSSSSVNITNCTFTGNIGGGIRNDNSSPTITNCTFVENKVENHRGGGIYNQCSSPTISNCTFSNNFASVGGGGIGNYESSPSITNCTFLDNEVENRGGGIYNHFSSPIITNCTFTGNIAPLGGAITNENSSPSITNCIIWKNEADSWQEIWSILSSDPTITYCDIDQDGFAGSNGNIEDPLFVDSSNSDFHLQPNSLCIDSGNNSVPGLPDEDLDGNPRVLDGDENGTNVVDMGAYEYLPDGDGLPDAWEMKYFGDLSYGPEDDYDEDELNNLGEYQHGTDPTNPDTDNDGLPDGWEVINELDPLDDTGDNGKDGDPDNDNWTNYSEYLRDTDPNDSSSMPTNMVLLVPKDYPTIQDAIDWAIDGDTVSVAPGTYYGNILITKSITLKSRLGPEVTIIDARNRGSALICHRGESVIIDGFTIQNGSSVEAGGIDCSKYVSAKIINNRVINNQGGGIGCTYGAVTNNIMA